MILRNLSWLDIFSGKISSFSWLLRVKNKFVPPWALSKAKQSKNQEILHFFCKFLVEICDKNGLVSASNGEFVPSRRTHSIWEIYVPWVWNIVSKCWIFARARFNFAWRLEFVKEFWCSHFRVHWGRKMENSLFIMSIFIQYCF